MDEPLVLEDQPTLFKDGTWSARASERERALASVTNAKATIRRARAIANARKSAKERARVDEGGKENEREDARAREMTNGSREEFARLRVDVDSMFMRDARGRERGNACDGDDGEVLRREESLNAEVASVVGDWFGDGGDAIADEGDRVLGCNLQKLYAPLRGDETLGCLCAEKSALKRRLRRFDARVAQTRGDKPTKEDKRHLRPLYVRLAKIKDLIAIREAGG